MARLCQNSEVTFWGHDAGPNLIALRSSAYFPWAKRNLPWIPTQPKISPRHHHDRIYLGERKTTSQVQNRGTLTKNVELIKNAPFASGKSQRGYNNGVEGQTIETKVALSTFEGGIFRIPWDSRSSKFRVPPLVGLKDCSVDPPTNARTAFTYPYLCRRGWMGLT
jgi:hypothetical protein